MKSITVFTPTYNRAYCLYQVYESLLWQSSKDFVWLIIDDGSSDTTPELVQSWKAANKIEIHYVYQENQGMHGAHNTAYKNIKTELNVCIDSDDFMPINAIELILKKWNLYGNDTLAGMIGLDAFKDGGIIGVKFPVSIQTATLTDLYHKYKLKGDKKVVIRTSVVKEFPLYPIFKKERFVPLGILYLMIDQKYEWFCTNDILCIVEYLPDGSSRNIVKQYQKSPKGFGYSRLVEMKYSSSAKLTFTRAVHYISSCLFQKKIDFFSGNPKKMVTLLALPFGFVFHLFILYKIKV
jgi:glycosyltransferase involved in cell wall biosynthesis